MVLKGAEPFSLEGNNVGCVLIHGLSSSPADVRPVGEFLNSKGYTVTAPLLPGHGTQIEDMFHYSWQDWYHQLEKTYESVAKKCSEVYLLGFSLGGLLVLQGAARGLPVTGIVSMAAPIYMGNRWASLVPFAKGIKKYGKKEKSANAFSDSGRIVYDRWVLHSVHEMLKLKDNIRRELPNIDKPVLIVHSKDDTVALPASAGYIHGSLTGAPFKMLKWLSRSEHIITMGPEKEEMFEQVDFFINNTKR